MMTETNTMKNLRLWLKECPAVNGTGRFNVDFMDSGPTSYALYSSPTAVNYGTDVLGNVFIRPVQELNYIFQVLFPYSEDVSQNLKNPEFFSDVMNWIYLQNSRKSFPIIEEGTVLSVMPTLSPYVYDGDGRSGRYQIQLKIKYRRRSDTERSMING